MIRQNYRHCLRRSSCRVSCTQEKPPAEKPAAEPSGVGRILDSKFSLTLCIYLYFLLVGAMYQWGYWRVFDFDIFPFLEPIDFIRLSVYPLAGSGLLVVLHNIVYQMGRIEPELQKKYTRKIERTGL